MNIEAFISEQESKFSGDGPANAASIAIVHDPVPLDSSHGNHSTPADLERMERMIKAMESSHAAAMEAFETIYEDPWRRRSVQEYLISDEIRGLEEKIEKQCDIVRCGRTEGEKEAAVKRVEEGMTYWEKLILWKIEGGK